jgi:hypothetical protein
MAWQLCEKCNRHRYIHLNTEREMGAYRVVKKLNEWTWDDLEAYVKENKTEHNRPFSLRNLGKMTGLSHEHVRKMILKVTPIWTTWDKD